MRFKAGATVRCIKYNIDPNSKTILGKNHWRTQSHLNSVYTSKFHIMRQKLASGIPKPYYGHGSKVYRGAAFGVDNMAMNKFYLKMVLC